MIGPIDIAAGTYRATATTAGFIIVQVNPTAGECGVAMGLIGYSPGLFIISQGQAANGAEAIFTSESCTALIEVSNVQGPWTLTFEKVG